MSAPDFSLTGRTALVTGARTGIGRACALALAAAGADVLCWGRAGDVGDTADAVAAIGRRSWAVGADLAAAVVFLASPAARYVNGHLLVVDGGWLGR